MKGGDRAREDECRGAAEIRDDKLCRGGYFARASLRRQAAFGTPARAGPSVHHQKGQIQEGEERHTVYTDPLANK